MLAIAVRLISGYVLLQLCLTVQWKWCALAADDHDIDNNHVPLDCTYDAARGIKLCDCGWRSEVRSELFFHINVIRVCFAMCARPIIAVIICIVIFFVLLCSIRL